MKEIVRITTIEITKIMVVSDEAADSIEENTAGYDDCIAERLLFVENADDVHAHSQVFVREVAQ